MSSTTSAESDDSLDNAYELGVNDLLDAIHGIKVPKGSLRTREVMQAVVSEIRKNDSFAMSSEVARSKRRAQVEHAYEIQAKAGAWVRARLLRFLSSYRTKPISC